MWPWVHSTRQMQHKSRNYSSSSSNWTTPPDATVVELADRVTDGAGVVVGPGPGFGSGGGEPAPPPPFSENVVELVPDPEHPTQT